MLYQVLSFTCQWITLPEVISYNVWIRLPIRLDKLRFSKLAACWIHYSSTGNASNPNTRNAWPTVFIVHYKTMWKIVCCSHSLIPPHLHRHVYLHLVLCCTLCCTCVAWEVLRQNGSRYQEEITQVVFS